MKGVPEEKFSFLSSLFLEIYILHTIELVSQHIHQCTHLVKTGQHQITPVLAESLHVKMKGGEEVGICPGELSNNFIRESSACPLQNVPFISKPSYADPFET